jgi:hypothetical protein
MVVEVVELEQGRSVAELAAALELEGGALVVLKWQQAKPTLASLSLPEDKARQVRCRQLLWEWRAGSSKVERGYTWPVESPR